MGLCVPRIYFDSENYKVLLELSFKGELAIMLINQMFLVGELPDWYNDGHFYRSNLFDMKVITHQVLDFLKSQLNPAFSNLLKKFLFLSLII